MADRRRRHRAGTGPRERGIAERQCEVGGAREPVGREFLERSQNLKGTVTNAIIYPVLLIIVMGLVVAGLIVK